MTNRYTSLPSTPIHPNSLFHVVILVCFVFSFSYLTARLGGAIVLRPEMIWPLWPGCAFLVAVLLLTPRKLWPTVLLAGIAGFALYDVQEHLPIRATGLLLAADVIEVLVAAVGVSYVFVGVPHLSGIKSLAKYSLFAVVLAPVSVASIASSALKEDSWWVAFFTEALALLTLTPALLSGAEIILTREKKAKVRYLEAALLFVGLATLAYVTFAGSGTDSRPTLLYSLVPFLLWATLRFGIAGASNSVALVSLVAILGVVHGRGPFLGGAPVNSVLSLQLFLLVAASSFMVLAAVVEGRKTAEQAVRESTDALRVSEERLRLAQQAAHIGTFERDVRTGVVTCTSGLERMYGLSPGGFEGTTFAFFESLIHPDDRERVISLSQQAIGAGQPAQAEWRVIWPDGTVHWIAGWWQVFTDQSGKPSRMIGANTDITEGKRAEEVLSEMSRKLIQAQEQERSRIGRELHDDIGQRIAMVSNELQGLQDHPSELQSRVHELRRRMSEISDDVQTLSHDLHSTKLQYLGVVAGIRSWCKEFGARHGMVIDFRSEVSSILAPELGLTIFRVIQEALHNAMKHSGVRRAEVLLEEDSNGIHLIVRDSGSGFDMQEAEKGSGLGLTSMSERVRLVNGTITIDSRLMGGTCVDVHLPVDSNRSSQRAAV